LVTPLGENVAETDCAEFIVTVQLAVPVQAPLQPAKVLPAPGCALRVTTVPLVYDEEQELPHEMPPGLLVTVPGPVSVTDST
jgi:hypothetical protein